MTQPNPDQEGQRDSGGGLHRDRNGDQDDPRDITALDGQRDTGGHQTHHQHLVVHPAHQMDEDQWVQHADPQRGRAVGAEMAGQAWSGPDQQRQPGQHAQTQQHGSGDDIVADDYRDELRNQNERRTVGRGGDRPDRAYVVQQRIGITDRANSVRIQTVAQKRPLGQIRVSVPAEDGHRQQ